VGEGELNNTTRRVRTKERNKGNEGQMEVVKEKKCGTGMSEKKQQRHEATRIDEERTTSLRA
jgi:hypothetical protein